MTNPSPNDPTCTADWVTYEFGPPHSGLSLPGCDRATGTWRNSNGDEGFASWSKPCDIPTSETITENSWHTVSPNRTIHRWKQTLQSDNPQIQFGGRTADENFPNDGSDTCWFVGSFYAKITKPDTPWGSWNVGFLDGAAAMTNEWGSDSIGWKEDRVNYYQTERLQRGLPWPCEFRVGQEMRIGCNAGPTVYSTGNIAAIIDTSQVTSQRRVHAATKAWP